MQIRLSLPVGCAFMLITGLLTSGCSKPGASDTAQLATTAHPERQHVNLYQPLSPSLSQPFLGKRDQLTSLALSPNGQLLVVGFKRYITQESSAGIVSVWDVASRKLLKSWHVDDGISDLAISAGNALLATGSNGEGKGYVRLWALPGGKLVRTLSEGVSPKVAFSKDEKLLATGAPMTVQLWSAPDWRLRMNLSDDGIDFTTDLAFSPTQSEIVCGRNDVSQTVRVVDYRTAKTLWVGGRAASGNVAYSPDGKLLASTSGEGLFVWNAHSGKLIYHNDPKDEGGFNVVFSPDNQILAIDTTENEGRHAFIQLRNTLTWKLIKKLPGGRPLAFTPDGKTLIGVDETGTRIVFLPM